MKRGDRVWFSYDGENKTGVVNYVTDTILNIRKDNETYRSYTRSKLMGLQVEEASWWTKIKRFLFFGG